MKAHAVRLDHAHRLSMRRMRALGRTHLLRMLAHHESADSLVATDLFRRQKDEEQFSVRARQSGAQSFDRFCV